MSFARTPPGGHIEPKIIRELATGRYLDSGDNLLLLGPPGVGKTHLAVALGLKACEQGHRALFTTAAGLIATLGKALAENRLDENASSWPSPDATASDLRAVSDADESDHEPSR